MTKSNWPEPSMMLTTSAWAKISSFSLMPITNDCPFVECLYNPMAKTLAIIGKTKKDTFHMVPRLDDNGSPQEIKGGTERKQQRVSQESYTEYYITEREEVENFIKKFAVNHAEFDYKKSLDMATMEDASNSPVVPGPKLILEK